jgi:signal peptidase I
LIQRIIGKPGDIIEVVSKKAVLIGVILEEPYLRSPPLYEMAPVQVPEGHYFVLGDNRNNSEDSHSGWTVLRASIVWKAWIFTSPPDKWGLVESYSLETNRLAQQGN